MKFRGRPNQLVRITKIKRTLIRRVPKSIRFDKDGIFETENLYLIKRLSVKFESVEECVKQKVSLEKKINPTELKWNELKHHAKEKGLNTRNMKKDEILTALGVL